MNDYLSVGDTLTGAAAYFTNDPIVKVNNFDHQKASDQTENRKPSSRGVSSAFHTWGTPP
ncbi:MAG: hypothetical protein IT307_11075 [Chloroflexi bacterium]|nr:hypothetical protein [Chloroflexota bacterium]